MKESIVAWNIFLPFGWGTLFCETCSAHIELGQVWKRCNLLARIVPENNVNNGVRVRCKVVACASFTQEGGR
jgi:hypothetical protein